MVYQEFDSDNIIESGNVYKDFDFDHFFWGYDSGYKNPRVFLKIGSTTDDRYVVIDEWYRDKWLLSQAIEDMKDEIGQDKIYCDPSAKSDIVEMENIGLRATGGDNTVDGGIQLVKSHLEDGSLLVSESCVELRKEFSMYRWDDNKDQPVKEFDHGLDALRYGLYSKANQREGGVGYMSLGFGSEDRDLYKNRVSRHR